jgi:transposase
MIGTQDRWQGTLFVAGSLETLIPCDHILKRVDKVLELSWLREEVREDYCETNGRPGIDPEAAIRLMLAGFFQGIVHDRKLMREAQVNLAIRWFAGYRLDEKLPDHSSLTRIRQRWGTQRFKRIFHKTVKMCIEAGLVNGVEN